MVSPNAQAVATEKREVGDGHGRTSSTLGAAFNVFCAVVGTGLLQASYGAAQTGWIGIAMLIVMGIMACYTAVVLIRCIELADKIQQSSAGDGVEKIEARKGFCVETYGDIGEAACGKSARLFVDVQNHLTLVGVGTIYNLLGGLNLATIAPEEWEWMTVDVAIALTSSVMWFHVFLKTMGEVGLVSAFNAAATLTLAIVVIMESLRHPPVERSHTSIVVPDLMKLGGGFASFAMAYGVHNVLPTIYGTMKSPREYEPMIKSTFVAIVAVTLPVMCVGYAVYGDVVCSPIYKTADLARSPMVRVMILLITLHLVGAYAIVLNPTELAVESAFRVEHRRCQLLWRICLRTMVVLFTCGTSMLLKAHFPPFLELTAAVTVTSTVFVLPCIFYARLSQMAGTPLSMLELAWNALIIAVAILGAGFGVICAVQDLTKAL
mmetsp:Transcript_84405/g.212920  ORF Transcript_84405/g.212920 Transcript_84405/m.212920 type:complete len:435 (+) Transcript_84405:51-1355(+)